MELSSHNVRSSSFFDEILRAYSHPHNDEGESSVFFLDPLSSDYYPRSTDNKLLNDEESLIREVECTNLKPVEDYPLTVEHA